MSEQQSREPMGGCFSFFFFLFLFCTLRTLRCIWRAAQDENGGTLLASFAALLKLFFSFLGYTIGDEARFDQKERMHFARRKGSFKVCRYTTIHGFTHISFFFFFFVCVLYTTIEMSWVSLIFLNFLRSLSSSALCFGSFNSMEYSVQVLVRFCNKVP